MADEHERHLSELQVMFRCLEELLSRSAALRAEQQRILSRAESLLDDIRATSEKVTAESDWLRS